MKSIALIIHREKRKIHASGVALHRIPFSPLAVLPAGVRKDQVVHIVEIPPIPIHHTAPSFLSEDYRIQYSRVGSRLQGQEYTVYIKIFAKFLCRILLPVGRNHTEATRHFRLLCVFFHSSYPYYLWYNSREAAYYTGRASAPRLRRRLFAAPALPTFGFAFSTSRTCCVPRRRRPRSPCPSIPSAAPGGTWPCWPCPPCAWPDSLLGQHRSAGDPV